MTHPTFLLDLDNTLLGNPMDSFLPAYFTALGRRLAPLLGQQDLRQLMYLGVQAMQSNTAPDVTNMEAFMADFHRRHGADPAAVEAVLDDFYREDFPTLQQVTIHRAEAAQIVSHLLAAGCPVVIATNPLFPATAIEQRLAWAGVDQFTAEYVLVTTMENSHFSKPHPHYYREILQVAGATPAHSWMVGDDLKLDIIPCHRLGLQTWWITDHLPQPPPEPPASCTQMGTLADFLAWAQAVIPANSPPG